MATESAITDTFCLDVVKVNNRRMTVSLFKQLYEQKPFNDEYELLYNLRGKVRHLGKEYVVFSTPAGIRKFDISKYKNKIGIQSLESSLYCCLHLELKSLELDHFGSEIRDYYSDKVRELDDDSYIKEGFWQLVHKSDIPGYIDRANIKDALVSLLEGNFKECVLAEYQIGVARIKKRDQLCGALNNTIQIYI